MKKMMNLMGALLLIIVIFSSCEKLDYIDPTPVPVESGITLKTTGAIVSGDTVSIEVQRVGIFKIDYSFTMTAVTVTFPDNSTVSVTPEGYFEKKWTQVGLTWLKITAVDNAGQVHERTYQVKVLVLFSDPVRFLSVTPVANSNFFKVRIALSKNGMIPGAYPFAFVGSVNGPTWPLVYFAVTDTNYRIENNVVYPMPTGQVGSWVSTELTLLPGYYEMGIGKVKNNQLTWGDFLGSTFVSETNTTMVQFTLLPNGTIAGNSSSLLTPGNIGDDLVSFSENTNGSWNVFLNNGVVFNSLPSPFLKSLLPTEVWGAPIAQSYVDGFPNWGQVLVSTPLPEHMLFQFGPNMQAPNYVTPMAGSDYYDSRYGYLAVSFMEMVVTKNSGEQITLIRPVIVASN
ncbi:MAG: hypothetical protein PHE20_02100 [Patescibacteria group bacterium]|nr:hypothetical protein [Patescibacteria group bacterium]